MKTIHLHLSLAVTGFVTSDVWKVLLAAVQPVSLQKKLLLWCAQRNLYVYSKITNKTLALILLQK